MNTVIILRGPAGVGKSTVAHLVQAGLGINATIIDVDALKKYMPLKPRQSNRAERSRIAHDVSKFFMKQMYDKGYDVILEEMYKKPYNDSLITFLTDHDIRFTKIFLYASVETVLERSRSRQKDAPDHEIRRHFAEITPYQDDFVIDTTKCTSSEAATIVLSRLG